MTDVWVCLALLQHNRESVSYLQQQLKHMAPSSTTKKSEELKLSVPAFNMEKKTLGNEAICFLHKFLKRTFDLHTFFFNYAREI